MSCSLTLECVTEVLLTKLINHPDSAVSRFWVRTVWINTLSNLKWKEKSLTGVLISLSRTIKAVLEIPGVRIFLLLKGDC